MRWKPCFASDFLIRLRHYPNGNLLIFNASTNRMMTKSASAVIWENRPTCSWFTLISSIATNTKKRNEKKPAHHHLPTRRCPATSSGTAFPEDKTLLEYLSILQSSDCGEAGATGESQMKTITIWPPAVEAAMLVEVQKKNIDFRNIFQFLVRQICAAHAKL